MKLSSLFACCLLLRVSIALAAKPEEDFQFDINDDLQVEFTEPRLTATGTSFRRLWGIPDTKAYVGKLFSLTVPKEAFSGHVKKYEVRDLPNWLLFDSKRGAFRGVPCENDGGEVTITLKAFGKNGQAKDAFTIEVLDGKGYKAGSQQKNNCSVDQRDTFLYLLVNGKLENLKARHRVRLMNRLSDFFAMNYNSLEIKELTSSDISKISRNAIKSGHGDGHTKKLPNSKVTAVQISIGCNGDILNEYKPMISHLKTQARDGAVSEMLGFPLIKWMVVLIPEVTPKKRARRQAQIEGSADGEYDYEYDDDEDEDEDEDADLPAFPVDDVGHTTIKSVIHDYTSYSKAAIATELDSGVIRASQPPTQQSPLPYNATAGAGGEELPSTADTSGGAGEYDATGEDDDDYGDEEDDDEDDAAGVTDVAQVAIEDVTTPRTPLKELEITPTRPTDQFVSYNPTMASVPSSAWPVETAPQSTADAAETESLPTSATPTTPPPTPPTEPPSTVRDTTPEPVTSPPPPPPPSPTTTAATPAYTPMIVPTFADVYEPAPEPRNYAPVIQHRLKKLPVTAGKAFSYIIPENTFHDSEDGHDLVLSMHNSSGASLHYSSWVQFDPSERKVYGLPLEEDVSKYEYIITAMDKQGATVSDNLEITVQHHKGRRTVNHEITLSVQSEKRLKKNTEVDLRFRVLTGLADVFGDPDLSQIIVTHIQTVVQPLQMTWTNDSLPRNRCPREEIDYLLKKLRQSPDNTEPTIDLVRAMAPELRVKSVSGGGIGTCAPPDVPPPPKTPVQNFAPMPRNQVDHLNATVGQLLVYKVPEDSFYDPEDGNARALKMYLLHINRTLLSPQHWLQFDTKNQEFYGVPAASDVGHKQYLLVCEDRGGLTATDGLVVAVHPASRRDFMVDFQMIIDTPYESFVNSAAIQRKFVDKLTELFGDRDSRYIKINSIREGSTVVSWSNTSLIGARCLQNEIDELKTFLLREDDTLSHLVDKIMGPEFPIISAKMTPTGVCRGELTVVHSPEGPMDTDYIPVDQAGDDYLITFVIPAIIIIGMLLLASIIACMLYRRRRTGKMELGDEEERQSFRNKGIPVIFQDELEEKPDPSNKSPVILKDEKPPLLPPPEYKGLDSPQHGTESDDNGPYQPPPPFASSRGSDSGRNNRPKPAPTYRKPPPYVPP